MEKVLIVTKKEIMCFDVGKLSHITSLGRISKFHTGNAVQELYIKLDEVMNLLPECYLRCHQSCIVNMNNIEIFGNGKIILDDGTSLNVSKSHYHNAKEKFLQYMHIRCHN